MSIGAFVGRELVTSVRQGRSNRDRLIQVVAVSAIVAVCALVWDFLGRDRATIPGQAGFALVALGVTALGQLMATGLLVYYRVGAAIARERDRKSLDAVLATRLSSAEIVLGAMAEGLVAGANGLLAAVPVFLIVFVAGVDPRYLLLFLAGLASTALAVASFSVTASVECGTRDRALRFAASLLSTWLALPYLILMIGPILRFKMPWWLSRTALWVLDSSPLGVFYAAVGIAPRPGSIVERLLVMITLELAGTLVLTAWAVRRLRPASRALHDSEGRSVALRLLRLSRKRLRPRTACGNDPVYWNEINAGRGDSLVVKVEQWFFQAVGLGMIVIGAALFAVPAFAELAERGYSPSREAFRMPEINPLARLLVSTLSGSLPLTRGTARLEFNSVLRQFTTCISMFLAMSLLTLASQTVVGERTRDTWLGLLATPLSGREILVGKMRGVRRKTRSARWLLLGLWGLGLLTGALHPLGFVAAWATLGLANRLYPMLGVAHGLWLGVEKSPRNPIVFLTLTPVQAVGVVTLVFAPSVLAWTALLTYEDVHSLTHGMVFPEFEPTRLAAVGARTVAVAWLGVMAAAAAGCDVFTRRTYRGFDAIVGRPVRPPAPDDASIATELKLESRLKPALQRET